MQLPEKVFWYQCLLKTKRLICLCSSGVGLNVQVSNKCNLEEILTHGGVEWGSLQFCFSALACSLCRWLTRALATSTSLSFNPKMFLVKLSFSVPLRMKPFISSISHIVSDLGVKLVGWMSFFQTTCSTRGFTRSSAAALVQIDCWIEER